MSLYQVEQNIFSKKRERCSMFTKYKNFINKFIKPNFLEWRLIESKLFIKKFDKGDTILHQGDICKDIYFINNGLARAYIIDEYGKDFTWSIFFNDENAHIVNLFVTEYDSFLHQKPSVLHIEALEACEFVGTTYENVQFLYDKLKNGERFGRIMAESAYSYAQNRIISQLTKSAKERFEIFMAQTPHLLNKVPQYHIATFLGITPQHLSRLKKEYRYEI